MEAKLRRQQGSFKLEFEGDTGEKGYVWLSYLPNSGVLVVRVVGSQGQGKIEVEDSTQ